ncbi:ATP-binding protein [Streptomyces sp. MNU76]|uniref:ATP-binding protein n=1 Tax=Streptomyces sp. MNU76 TaxID=2560026 RepID=UPI001E3E4E4A|nr:ATP-binding protein [Streptomyces sp. MNU76]MCC9704458.1 ATP-binding protein [Streptomyces sp. MNU76]
MSEGLRLRMEFRGPELALVRALVEEASLRARLPASVRGAFGQAAVEFATDAAARGADPGVVELRAGDGELLCEVTYGGAVPPPGRPEGHGPGLAESLIAGIGAPARIGVRDTPHGTTVTLSAPLAGPLSEPPPGPLPAPTPDLVRTPPATAPPAR